MKAKSNKQLANMAKQTYEKAIYFFEDANQNDKAKYVVDFDLIRKFIDHLQKVEGQLLSK